MTTATPSMPLIPFHRTTRRTVLACAALAALNIAALPAIAQSAPSGIAAGAAGESADPPGRVARLDYTAGAVTTEPAGASDWSYAELNRPLTAGDQLWNDQNARSELHIGSTAVRLGAQTSVDILNLDDSVAQLKVAQGTLSARVRELPAGTSYEIDTPNLAVGANGPGDYRVDVAPDGSSTTVTVRSGSVTVYGENGQTPMSAGQQIRFAGTDLQQVASDSAPPPDSFDQWAGARDAAEDRSVSARYVSRDMPGYQDLDANGTWRDDPQYGEVWVPSAVPAGWAPYHDGHWIWQAPWGWTWVDDAPWGFAPYHYGRWASVDDTWAWVPGPVVEDAPPVYAPALVAFVGGEGGGPDWSVSLAAGGIAAAGVAWFALGPGEPWHPGWAGWSPRYYERVNHTVIVNNDRRDVNITNIHNTFVNYRVRGAVTAMPATAFVHGQPVARFAQHVDPQQWHNARINSGAPGIAPVKGSFGSEMRRADYRPPSALAQRPVVATRSPIAPPAYRDNLAQRFAHAGGAVPGAGAPVVRVSAPAHAPMAAALATSPGQNVRVVPSHGPVLGAAGRPTGAPMQPGRPAGFPVSGPAPQRDAERGQPGQPPSAANARGPAPLQQGVPRPPQVAGRPEGGQPGREAIAAAPGAARQPMWLQPHAPIASRSQPAANDAGRPAQLAMQAPREADRPTPQPVQREAAAGASPQMQAQRRGLEVPPQPQAQARTAPQPQPQPREAFHPQPQAQPRAEFHPQPQPQPRAEVHPQPQPRAEFHPQPQPQPRAEPRPQPQPQPRAEARPQPQPHPAEHANGGRDDHHHG